jgi:hypothetical protein
MVDAQRANDSYPAERCPLCGATISDGHYAVVPVTDWFVSLVCFRRLDSVHMPLVEALRGAFRGTVPMEPLRRVYGHARLARVAVQL